LAVKYNGGMDILGFITGFGLGLLISLVLGTIATYFVITWKLKKITANAGAFALGKAKDIAKEYIIEAGCKALAERNRKVDNEQAVG